MIINVTCHYLLAAERLLQQTGGSVETAIAVFFSSDQTTIVQEEPSTPRTQLRAILGSSVTARDAERLLARAHSSVQEAVDLYYTAGGEASSGCCSTPQLPKLQLHSLHLSQLDQIVHSLCSMDCRWCCFGGIE